jgi:hypothetical protein
VALTPGFPQPSHWQPRHFPTRHFPPSRYRPGRPCGAGGFGGFGGAGGRGGGSTDAAQISAWVQAHFKAQTVGGMTVYNLITPTAGS